MEGLLKYFMLVAPSFLVGATLLLLVLPQSAAVADLRMMVHIVLFASARDAMLPAALWSISMSPKIQSRFKASSLQLVVLAAMCANLSAWIVWQEPAMTAWSSPSPSMVCGNQSVGAFAWFFFLDSVTHLSRLCSVGMFARGDETACFWLLLHHCVQKGLALPQALSAGDVSWP